MRIQFQAEGGFAHIPGLSRPLAIDTASLPPTEAATLEGLVRAASLFTRPTQIGGQTGAADYRTYTITVEDAGKSHTIQVREPIDDPALQAVIDHLRARQKGPA